ncbi:MAG: alpha/beta fold hydrolase [Silvanigrellales bacterium]|nr:alpha/beta fold hydrolase [Silvanigrellales bacterium]
MRAHPTRRRGRTPHGCPAPRGPGVVPDPLPLLKNTAFGRTLLERCEVVFPHQRGAGRSLLAEEASWEDARRTPSHYGIQQYLSDLEVLRLACAGGGAWHVVGSSWGGYLALAYAAAFPAAVRSVVAGSCECTLRSTTLFGDTIERIL